MRTNFNLQKHFMEVTLTEQQIREQLSMNIGSEKLYYHPLFKGMNYTEGITHLRDLCQCHWLVIDVLCILKTLQENYEFITIKLHKEKESDTCRIDYEDGNGNVIKNQQYPFTDFPLNNYMLQDKIRPAIMLYYTNQVLLLPSEY